ncbi:HepT-like ribonuclease domain-containing protein [Caminibacter sp.]
MDKEDIKGAYVVRNFIAHDYEGVDLAFIENILRFKLNELKIQLKN